MTKEEEELLYEEWLKEQQAQQAPKLSPQDYSQGIPSVASAQTVSGGAPTSREDRMMLALEIGKDVLNEAHPGLSKTDQYLIRTLGASGKEVEQLQKKYPDFEFRVTEDNDIEARKLDEPVWSKVFDSGPRAVRAGLDYLTGLGSTGAAIGGGTLGLMSGPMAPVAAPALAIGAGAGTGYGLEKGRQALGGLFGLQNNVSEEEAQSAAIGGGLSPLLFGAGKVKGMPEKAFEKWGVPLWQRAVSWGSGVPEEMIKWMRENTDDLLKQIKALKNEKRIVTFPGQGRQAPIVVATEAVGELQDKALKKVGADLGTVLTEGDKVVPPLSIEEKTKIYEPLFKLVDDMSSQKGVSKGMDKAAKKVSNKILELMPNENIPLTPSILQNQKLAFKAVGKPTGQPASAGTKQVKQMYEKRFQGAAKKVSENISNNLDSKLSDYGKLNKQYESLLEQGKFINEFGKEKSFWKNAYQKGKGAATLSALGFYLGGSPGEQDESSAWQRRALGGAAGALGGAYLFGPRGLTHQVRLLNQLKGIDMAPAVRGKFTAPFMQMMLKPEPKKRDEEE